MFRHRFLWLACITLLACPLSLSAQTTTGTVRGYVKDQNGAPVAPGVTVSEDRINAIGFRTFSAGGASPNQSNVFVDGSSLKNDLTGGGVAGQDASRGNPFPRNAIQEYRVITQNFKAEYQKASSAIITATTRSGGNTWSGNAFIGYQNKDLVALDTFQT